MSSITNGLISIGAWAFDDCTGLTNFTIPHTVSNIGAGVFVDATNLSAIQVNTNSPYYTSANGVLFNKNKTLLVEYPSGKSGSLTIPNSVTNLETDAFYDSGLTSLNIPGSVTGFGEDVCYGCSSLTNVTIAYGITSIGSYGFAYCVKLSSFTLPDSVTNIGAFAFADTGLTNITFRIALPASGRWLSLPVIT